MSDRLDLPKRQTLARLLRLTGPGSSGGRDERPMGERMIAETQRFLDAALHADLPRIPRRRCDEGGYDPLMRIPGARRLADRFWERVLDQVGRWCD